MLHYVIIFCLPFPTQDGHQYGDEYLAELDMIEVVERTKEGYESDVVDPDEEESSQEEEEEEEEGEEEYEEEEDDNGSDRWVYKHLSRHKILGC